MIYRILWNLEVVAGCTSVRKGFFCLGEILCVTIKWLEDLISLVSVLM